LSGTETADCWGGLYRFIPNQNTLVSIKSFIFWVMVPTDSGWRVQCNYISCCKTLWCAMLRSDVGLVDCSGVGN